MKAPYLLQLVGLPALVLAGLGVGAAAAKYGATDSEIPLGTAQRSALPFR